MIARRIKERVLYLLKTNSSVALMGTRQVGKTTLAIDMAKTVTSVYLDLENRIDLQKVENIDAFHRQNSKALIILDEVQRLPEVFAPIRGIIDKERRKGNKSAQFLFLGSASIELLKQSSESLAGRIAYIELFPIDVTEYLSMANEIDKLNELWVKGGFPDSLLANEEDSLNWRLNFIRTYLERDIPQLGLRIPAQTLERFWIMLAHSQGTNINASKIAANMDVSSVTIARYLDLFVDLFLIRKLPPYIPNIKKRLVKSPRIYVRDSGVLHALLHIKSFNELLGHPVVGKSWEGFVIENIISVLPNYMHTFYYRTAKGAEIDLIIEFGLTDIWAIEIKKGTSLHLSKGFYDACKDIKPSRKFLVYLGEDRFPLSDEITAISLFDLIKEISKKVT